MVDGNVIESFIDAIKTEPVEKTNAYSAVVSRIDNEGVVWVNISGSEKETPTEAVASEVKRGDAVTVEWRNNKLYIAGNTSNPSAGVIRVDAVERAAGIANQAAQSAVADASIAKEAADSAIETANSVEGIATRAEGYATEAKKSADTAFTNLAQVQSVLEVAEWIATHGTYVKAATWNPNATYYTVTATQVAEPSDSDKDSQGVLIYYELNNGIYVRTTDTQVDAQKTYYRVIGIPVAGAKAEDMAQYYTLAVTDAMANYIKSHLALTDDGLYVMADGSKWKVKVSDDGVYILDSNNQSANQMTGNGNIIGYENETHAEVDYHSMKLIDKETFTYFHISDLREWKTLGENMAFVSTIYQRTIGRKISPDVALVDAYIYTSSPIDSLIYVKLNGEDVTSDERVQLWKDIYGTWYVRFSWFDIKDGDELEIAYYSESTKAKAYTFGLRGDSGSIGFMSVAEGDEIVASGMMSHAEGYKTIAYGYASHAEGYETTAYAEHSHAEGYKTEANGSASHAEGRETAANKAYSHAEGYLCVAGGQSLLGIEGTYSHAQNLGTLASKMAQTAIGSYNIEDEATETTHPSGEDWYGQYALIIGNGTDDNNRSNACTVDWDGNVEASGDVTDGNGNVLSNMVAKSILLDFCHPVGSYYYTDDADFDPNDSWGGTWSLLGEGQVLLSGSASGSYRVGTQYGDNTASLEIANMPAHNHNSRSLIGTVTAQSWNNATPSGIVSSEYTNFNLKSAGSGTQFGTHNQKINATHTHDTQGSGTAFSIMQKSTAVYIWHRNA